MNPAFDLGERRQPIRHESLIPRNVTEELLRQTEYTEQPPPTVSSTVERYIVACATAGITDPADIFQRFQSTGALDQLTAELQQLADLSDEQPWDALISTVETSVYKEIESVINKLGLPTDLAAIRAQRFSYEATGAASTPHSIDKWQCVRKASDYVRVHPDIDFSTALQVILKATLGHELGHLIEAATLPDDLMSNHIPYEWSGRDNRSERFAEFLGRAVLVADTAAHRIIQEQKIMYVAEVHHVWPAARSLALLPTLEYFRTALPEGHAVRNLIEARQFGYSANAPENYALPYRAEQIKECYNE